MTRKALEAVVGRAILDAEFRLALFADPCTALAGYELTPAEQTALKAMDAENVDACARRIGQRVLNALALAEHNTVA